MHIDSHQHFWKYHPVNHAWIKDDMKEIQKNFLPPDLALLLHQHKIEGCVTVQADQTEQENQFLLSLARENDFIKGVVGWVDLRADNLNERLDFYKQFPTLKGFRHIVQGESKGFLANPKFIAGVRKLGQRDFTYDLLIYHFQLEDAVSFVQQVPGVKIVLDHIAKPSISTGEIEKWKQHIKSLAASENIFCKISGMVTEANWKQWGKEDFLPYLDVVFEAFGEKRVMYGSDWPVCLVAASYAQQLAIVQDYISTLSQTQKDRVMGENAKTFYNL
jgi:L-fuconolactonase